jgi:putative salt-induced outer membrane protein YdiY
VSLRFVRQLVRGVTLSLIGLTAVGARAASAQDGPAPAPETGVTTLAPKPAPPPWVVFHADLGLVNASGNSNVTTANASDALTVWTDHSNKIGQTFGLVYGTSNNKVQTNLWTAGLRDEYTFTPAFGVYGLVSFDRNTFAGINQRFEEGVGAALIPVNSGPNRLEIDLGVSYLQQQTTMDSSSSYAAGRGALIYRYTFVKDTYFQEAVDDLSDFSDFSNYRINSQTDLVAPLSKHIALKIGYQIRYSNEPPPGFKTTDRFLTSDLQFNF